MLCTFAFFFSVTAHAEDQTKLQLYVPANSEARQETAAASASTAGKDTGSTVVATGDTSADWASTTLVTASVAALLILCRAGRNIE